MPVSASNSMLAVPPPTLCASIDPAIASGPCISRRVNGIGSSGTCTPRRAVGSLNDSESTITTFTPARPAGSRVALIRSAAAR